MSRTKGAIKLESLNHDASHVATLEAYLQKNAGNKLVLNVDDVARLCGLKRSSTFDAVRRGDLPCDSHWASCFCTDCGARTIARGCEPKKNLAESFEIKPVSEEGLAAEINVRLDNECDQAIARDDERDE